MILLQIFHLRIDGEFHSILLTQRVWYYNVERVVSQVDIFGFSGLKVKQIRY